MAPKSPFRQSVPLVGKVSVLLPRVLVCVWQGGGGAGEEVGGRREWGQSPFTHSWPGRKVRPLPCLFPGQFDFPPEPVEGARQWGFKLAEPGCGGRTLAYRFSLMRCPTGCASLRPKNPKDRWVRCAPPSTHTPNGAGSLWPPDPGQESPAGPCRVLVAEVHSLQNAPKGNFQKPIADKLREFVLVPHTRGTKSF